MKQVNDEKLKNILQYKNSNVIIRYCKDFNCDSTKEAQMIFKDTLSWLYLSWIRKQKYNKPTYMIPAFEHLDKMWHTFILYSKDYTKFCHQYFNEYIHHTPEPHENPTLVSEEEILDTLSDAYDFCGTDWMLRLKKIVQTSSYEKNHVNKTIVNINTITKKDINKLFDFLTVIDNETDFLLLDHHQRNIYKDKLRTYFVKLIDSQYSTILTASNQDNELVGYITAEQLPLKKTQHTLNIVIAVKKSYSNQGVGTRLLEEVINHARKIKLHRLECEIFSENKYSLKLFKKLGFAIEGSKKNAIKINDKYQDLYLLGKILDK